MNGATGRKPSQGEFFNSLDWLAATLLLPRPALLRIVQSGLDLEQEALRYRTSDALLRMRLNQTGVNMQMRRRVA